MKFIAKGKDPDRERMLPHRGVKELSGHQGRESKGRPHKESKIFRKCDIGVIDTALGDAQLVNVLSHRHEDPSAVSQDPVLKTWIWWWHTSVIPAQRHRDRWSIEDCGSASLAYLEIHTNERIHL